MRINHVHSNAIKPTTLIPPVNGNTLQGRGLVGWWPIQFASLDKMESKTHLLDGVFNGPFTIADFASVEEPCGSNIRIDGRNRWIEVPDVADLEVVEGDELTVSYWFNTVADGTNRQEVPDPIYGSQTYFTRQTVFTNGYVPARQNYNAYLFSEDLTRPSAIEPGLGFFGNRNFYTTDSGIVKNTWNHVVLTISFVGLFADIMASAKAFINGDQCPVTWNNSFNGFTRVPNADPLRFGRTHPNNPGLCPFVGYISDVRIYKNNGSPEALAWSLYNPATRWDLYRDTTQFLPHIAKGWAIPEPIDNQNIVEGPTIIGFGLRMSQFNVQVVGATNQGSIVNEVGVEVLGDFLNPDPVGGIQAGGTAIVETPGVGSSRVAEGGAVLGGQALKPDTAIVSGGALVDGYVTSDPRIVASAMYVQVVASFNAGLIVNEVGLEVLGGPELGDGILAGGINSNDCNYTINDPSQGLQVGGTVIPERIFPPEVITGGVVGGGIGFVYRDNTVSTSGGSVVNGSATNEKYSTELATGAALVSGSHLEDIEFNISTSGGLVGGGTANVYSFEDRVTSGGVLLAGISPAESAVPVFGGSTVSGTNINTVDSMNATSGGVVNGGTNINTVDSMNIASGGILGAGVSNVNKTSPFSFVASGSLTMAGSVTTHRSKAYAGSGGMVLSGAIDDPKLSNWNFVYNVGNKNYRIFLGGTASPKSSKFVVEAGMSRLTAGGQSQYSFFLEDRLCANELTCVVTYPNRHTQCFVPLKYYARRGKGVFNRYTRPANLPAITACRQYLYLPDPYPKKDQ